MTSITDFNGQQTTLAYSGGVLSSITDPAHRTATLGYNGTWLTTITDAGNHQWQYGYVASKGYHTNLLAQLNDPNNYSTNFIYNLGVAGSVFQDILTNAKLPDGALVALSARQTDGLPNAGDSSLNPAAPAGLGESASFTDGNSHIWQTNLDWLGYGVDVEDIDPLGDVSMSYTDTNGLLWLSADPLARRDRTFYDGKGNATQIVADDDTTRQYQYNSFGEPTQYTDPTNQTTTNVYNAKGDLTSTTDALNHTTTNAYNSHGLLTSSTDPLLHTTSYGYDALNRLTSTTNALIQTISYTYDNASNRTGVTDARGLTSTFGYDSLGRMTGETLAINSTTSAVYTLTYDGVGNLVREQDPLNMLVSYTYDGMNRLLTIMAPLADTTTLKYDLAGNETSVTNALNETIGYTYDNANRLTQISDPATGTTTFALDAAGETTSSTNALNYTTTYSYDLQGRLSSVTDPMLYVTSYSYNAAGDTIATTRSGPGQGSQTTTQSYDTVHRLTGVTDPLNHSSTYGYDAANNRTSVTDALGHAVTYGYDMLNRVNSVTDALGHQTTYGYDSNGNQTSITDPLSHVTSKTFDDRGRLLTVTDPRNGTTNYAYNLAGLLTSLTDSVGNQTTYGYDAHERVSSVTDPLGHSTTYAYNAIGKVTSETDRDGRVRNFGYNSGDQLTSETWVNGGYTATYTYDALGRLKGASDTNSSYSYTYDPDNRLTAVDNSGTPGVPHVVLNYGYDAFDNRTSLSDSLGGNISYTFDSADRLTGLNMTVGGSAAATLTLSYDNANRLTGLSRSSPGGDNIQTAYSYDNANRLTNILHTDVTKASTLANYTYGYDIANRLTSYQDSNSSLSYGYDNADELTSASGTLNGSNFNATYSYDLNGNRNMTGYQTTHNELTSDGVYNYTYDNEGNTLTQTQIATGTVTYYTWDYRNRLTEVQVKTSGGMVLNDEKFTYDVNNNRIGVSLNGTQQLYTVYDGSNPYIDFNGSGSLTQRYLTNPQALSQFYARVNGSGTVKWYLTDNIQSVRQIVDALGNVQDKLVYDPFGSIVSETSATNGDRFKYTSGQYDSVTGNDQLGARAYGPWAGRFWSQDPLAFKGGDGNLYRYVRNDPTSAVDPSGLAPIPVPPGLYLAVAIANWFFGASPSPPAGPAMGFWNKELAPKGARGAEFEKFQQGCLGLAKIRLGLPIEPFGPHLNPGVRCFRTFEAAMKYRDSLEGDDKKNARIFAVKYQEDKDPAALRAQGIVPKKGLEDEIDPRTVVFHGSGDVATLHETSDGMYWEDMNHGLKIPDPKGEPAEVKHYPFNKDKKYKGLPYNEGPVMYCVIITSPDNPFRPPSKYDK